MIVPVAPSYETVIDDADAPLICGLRLHAHKSSGKVYVRAHGCGKRAYLHRLLLNAPSGMDVDHIDGNPLNNARSNLRVTSRTINNLNRPRSKGYYYEARTNTYRSDIWVNGTRIRLGRFRAPEDAHMAYLVEKSKYMDVSHLVEG